MPLLKALPARNYTTTATESLNAVLKLWLDHCQNESRVVYDHWRFFLSGYFKRGPTLVLGLGNDSRA